MGSGRRPRGTGALPVGQTIALIARSASCRSRQRRGESPREQPDPQGAHVRDRHDRRRGRVPALDRHALDEARRGLRGPKGPHVRGAPRRRGAPRARSARARRARGAQEGEEPRSRPPRCWCRGDRKGDQGAREERRAARDGRLAGRGEPTWGRRGGRADSRERRAGGQEQPSGPPGRRTVALATVLVALSVATRNAAAQEIQLTGPLGCAPAAVRTRLVTPVMTEWAYWVSTGASLEQTTPARG